MGVAKMYAEVSHKNQYIWGWYEIKKTMKKIYHRRLRRISKQNLLKNNYA